MCRVMFVEIMGDEVDCDMKEDRNEQGGWGFL